MSAIFESEPDAVEAGGEHWQSLYVHFETPKDRVAFAAHVGQVIHSNTKTIAFPFTSRHEVDTSVVHGVEEQPDLMDVDADWAKLWQGMPSYDHEDLQPWQSIVVEFTTQADRAAFGRLVGQTLNPRTKFIWYPKVEIGTAADKVFTAPKRPPRYPVYIISKGRWDSRLTQKCFEWIQVPYHIVVEPQELERYVGVGIPREKILVLPFSNLGLGGIPARNWVWEHSISTGAARHWIFDDNVSGLCRFQDNLKVEVDNAVTMRAVEDWCDRYENLKMAAFNYDYFAPRKQGAKIRPITLNTRCYSGILLSNDLPHRWRGRYNEDTDLSLRILKDGYCTALFNAFLMYKKPTLTMKGGNTDELYAGVEATVAAWEAHALTCDVCVRCFDGYGSKLTPCAVGREVLAKDGRWLMAESLRDQHPAEVTVERKWRRWQHQVDYRAFARNPLRLRADAVIGDGSEYAMTLAPMPPDAPSTRGGNSLKRHAPKVVVEDEPERPTFSVLDFLKLVEDTPPEPALEPKPAPRLEAPAQPAEPALGRPEQPASLVEPEAGPGAGDGLATLSRGSALELAIDLRARGHRLLTRDGKFFISETPRLTVEDRAAIKVHRETLIAMAEPWEEPSAEQADVQSRVGQPRGTDEQPAAVHAVRGPEEAADEAGHDVHVSGVRGEAGGQEVALLSEEVARTSVAEAFSTLTDSATYEPPAGDDLFQSQPQQTLAEFLSGEVGPARLDTSYVPDEPPDLDGIDHVVLNFATNGLHWDAVPVGVTVSTMDGQLSRFLPFGFLGGGNLDPDVVKRWAQRQLRGKKITNANTRFDMHKSLRWGVDLEEQGCTFSDVMHTAALLDDHRKQFALDKLIEDYLPGQRRVARVDENRHHEYHASEVAAREVYTAQAVAKLVKVMYPQLVEQDLVEVQQIEDRVLPAVVAMEENGAPIDVELLEQYGKECVRRHDDIIWELAKEVGFAFDHSAKGWQRLLEVLHLPPTDGNSEAVLNAIDHPTVKKAQRAAQYASLNSKIFKAYPKLIRDGILRFEINQLRGEDGGTVTGRFSASPIQQVPNKDNHHAVFGDDLFPRRLYIPGKGRRYIAADAAQIQYRIFAHFVNNPRIMAMYAADPWASFHRMIEGFIRPYKPDLVYSHVKNMNFMRIFGGKLIKLAVMMGYITDAIGEEIRAAKGQRTDQRLAKAREIDAIYSREIPEVDEVLRKASHLAMTKCNEYCKRGDKLHRMFPHRGFVRTIAGRRSRFPDDYRLHKAFCMVDQGSEGDIVKTKIAELHEARKETGFLMRMTVHDEVTGDELAPDTLEKVTTILNRQSFPQLKVPILWDGKAGANWAECK